MCLFEKKSESLSVICFSNPEASIPMALEDWPTSTSSVQISSNYTAKGA